MEQDLNLLGAIATIEAALPWIDQADAVVVGVGDDDAAARLEQDLDGRGVGRDTSAFLRRPAAH